MAASAPYTPAEVFAPGEFIKEELEAREWTQGDLAAVMARPIQAINEIISGKRAITTETAQALASAFGTSAQLWMNLDSAWRLSLSTPDNGDIERRAKLFSKAPVKELIKRMWIEDSKDFAALEERVMKFMGMRSLDDAPTFAAAARKSTTYGETTPSQVAWLRKALELARGVGAKRFHSKRFADQVRDIRELAGSEADIRRIPRFLSEIGVRFVLVEHLSGTKMDGAAFWINESSPAVALSMRYDRIDHLWFVLGHELGHIANGHGAAFFDDDMVGEEAAAGTQRPECERVADEFSEGLLIPKEEIEDFIGRVRPLYSRKRIVGFANRMGVHPGIVIGQLQFRGEIGYWHSRPLLAKVRNELSESAMTDGWGHTSGV